MLHNKNEYKFSYYYDNNVANAIQIIIINHKFKNQTNHNFKNYFSINLNNKILFHLKVQ
jgi:hypothetical protein